MNDQITILIAQLRVCHARLYDATLPHSNDIRSTLIWQGKLIDKVEALVVETDNGWTCEHCGEKFDAFEMVTKNHWCPVLNKTLDEEVRDHVD